MIYRLYQCLFIILSTWVYRLVNMSLSFRQRKFIVLSTWVYNCVMPVPAQLISPRAGMKSSDILWYFMSKIIPCWIYTDRWNSLLEIAEMAFRDCGTYYSTVFNPLSEDFEPAVWVFWTSSLSERNRLSDYPEHTVRWLVKDLFMVWYCLF